MRSMTYILAATLVATPLTPLGAMGGTPATCGAGSLAFAPEGPQAAQSALTFAPGAAPDSLRVVGSEKVTGPCAANLRAATGENLITADGKALRRLPGGGVEPKAGMSIADRTIEPRQPHPEGAGTFRMAYRVGYRRAGGQLTTNYVGVWQDGAGSSVRYFSKQGDGSFTPAQPLLSSSAPLRSVTYFPSPDAPSGRLDLVQELPGAVRLIAVNWSHRGIFG